MIVSCQACGSAATLPDDHGGRRFACPQCGAVLATPSTATAAVADNDPLAALAAANAAASGGSPYHPHGPAVQRGYRAVETAPGAVAALVCGILTFVTSCVGIILAIIAIAQANKAQEYLRRYPGQYSGEGMASAGKILGIIGLVMSVISLLGLCLWFTAVGAIGGLA